MAKQKTKSDKKTSADAFLVKDELRDQREYIQKVKADRLEDLNKQRELLKKLGDENSAIGFVDEAKFIESMRDVGYKSTAFALAELVDNSIQAGAESVHIVLQKGKGNLVTAIAVVDDGHGMDPGMILESIRWGGTHRHTDRDGFGRFGMGKPSSCVSQGRRFTSFSKTADGSLHSVRVDLDEIADEATSAMSANGRRIAPPQICSEEQRSCPEWIQAYRRSLDLPAVPEAGTIVVLENLDNVAPKRVGELSRNLMQELGMIYRYFTSDISIFVDGKETQAVDPLFTLPWHRDPAAKENPFRAEDKGTIKFEVKDHETGGSKGWIRVRFSRLPNRFPRNDLEKGVGSTGSNGNARWPVMARNKGIHILRKGRQVDWIESRCPWTTFVNYDRNWSCEIDFDPGLDEYFRITTAKQQVIVSERMWGMLKDHGVHAMLEKIRLENKIERAQENVAESETDEDGVRKTEKAAEQARKHSGRNKKTAGGSQVKKDAEKNTQTRASQRAKKAGVLLRVIENDLKEDIKRRAYKFESDDLGSSSPFFISEVLGADDSLQIRVTLNRDHLFYREIYASSSSTKETREAIELLLLSIGEHQAEAKSEKVKNFYGRQVMGWSQTLQENIAEYRELSVEDQDGAEDEESEAA
jgi:dihydrofolate reductase